MGFNLLQVRFNNSVYCVSCFHYTLFLPFFNLFKVSLTKGTLYFSLFLLFSAPFHAVFVLEALILLGWRFTDFFYIIFNNLCFNQRKSSSPLTKTEASFEYLNHTRNPAFAVHPCPSPIFCHQEDKSELRGATPHFLPRLSPKPAQEWLPANFTVHSDFSSTVSAIRLLSPATSVIGGFLHRQSRVHCWLYLCHTSCHTDTPQAYSCTAGVYCCTRKFRAIKCEHLCDMRFR